MAGSYGRDNSAMPEILREKVQRAHPLACRNAPTNCPSAFLTQSVQRGCRSDSSSIAAASTKYAAQN
jgi:hypothetical protein